MEGLRGNTLLSSASLFLSLSFYSSLFLAVLHPLPFDSPPWPRARISRSRSPLLKSVQDVRERGTTHRASQITPLSKSPDLLALWCTPCSVAPPLSLKELPSFSLCPLFLYSVVSRGPVASSSLPLRAPTHRPPFSTASVVFVSFALSSLHSSSRVADFFFFYVHDTL